MNRDYVQVLIDTMVKKEETLQKILEITEQQEILSKRESYVSEEMERTLNEKEVFIDRLNNLDEGFQTVYDRIHGELRSHKEQYRQELMLLRDKIRRCTELGNRIQVLERRNRSRFEVLFSKGHSDYSSSKNRANVAQNYFKTMNHSKVMDAYFVDKKQ